MGRFYRTSATPQLDFMSQLPIDLMIKGIQTTDAANNAIYSQTDLLDNAVLNVPTLLTDQKRADEIKSAYQSEINELTESLAKDPTQYRAKMPLLRNLSRKLSEDMNSGELAALKSNYNKLAQWEATYKPLVAKGEYSPQAYATMRAKFISDYEKAGGNSYDKTTKNYNQLQTEDIAKTQDFNKLLSDNIKDIKANAQSRETKTGQKEWLVTNKGKTEYVSAARVAQIATDTLLGNQEVLSYLKQGGKYGYLNGVYGEDGSFINPYTIDEQTGNPVFNSQSILTAPIRALVGKEAFMKTESSIDYDINPVWKHYDDQAQDVKMLGLRTSADIEKAKIDREADWAIKQEELKLRNELANDLDAQKVARRLEAKGGKGATVVKAKVDANGVGKLTVSNHAGAGNRITDAGVREIISKNTEEAEQLAILVKDPNLNPELRGLYQQQLTYKQGLVQQQSDLLNMATKFTNEETNKKFSEFEIKEYSKYRNDPNYRKKLEEIASKGTVVKAGLGNVETRTPLAETALSRLKKMKEIDSFRNKTQASWFTKNSDATNTEIKTIQLDDNSKALITNGVKVSPNVQFFSLAGTEDDDSVEDAEKMIAQAVKEGKDLSTMLEVKSINSPAPGIGVTATVRLNGQKTDVLMSLPSSSINAVGKSLKKSSTSQEVAGIADLISNQGVVDFISAANNRLENVAGGNGQPYGIASIFNSGTGMLHNIKVVPLKDPSNPNTEVFQAYNMLPNGKQVLFGKPTYDTDGKLISNTTTFNSVAAIAEAFKSMGIIE